MCSDSGTLLVYVFLLCTCVCLAETVSPLDLQRGIAERITRVPEFAEIKRIADREGISLWLFGGSAASLAHYVKRDLKRERGDKSLQAERFDYDFTRIYRPSQDIDIVIDGNEAQVQKFRSY